MFGYYVTVRDTLYWEKYDELTIFEYVNRSHTNVFVMTTHIHSTAAVGKHRKGIRKFNDNWNYVDAIDTLRAFTTSYLSKT